MSNITKLPTDNQRIKRGYARCLLVLLDPPNDAQRTETLVAFLRALDVANINHALTMARLSLSGDDGNGDLKLWDEHQEAWFA